MFSSNPKELKKAQAKPPFFRLEFDKTTQGLLYQAAAETGVPVEVFADGIHCTIAYKNYRNDPRACMEDGVYAKNFLMPHVGEQLSLNVKSIVIKEHALKHEWVVFFQVAFEGEYLKDKATHVELEKPAYPHISMGKIVRSGHYGNVMGVVELENKFAMVMDELKSTVPCNTDERESEVEQEEFDVTVSEVSNTRGTSGDHCVIPLNMTIQGTLSVSETYAMTPKKNGVIARAAYIEKMNDCSLFPFIETAVLGGSKFLELVQLKHSSQKIYAVVHEKNHEILTWVEDFPKHHSAKSYAGKPFQLNLFNITVNQYVTLKYALICTKGDAALVCINDEIQYQKDLGAYSGTSLARHIIECGMKHQMLSDLEETSITGEYYDGMNITSLSAGEQPSLMLHHKISSDETLKELGGENNEQVILHEARNVLEACSSDFFLLDDVALKQAWMMALQPIELEDEYLQDLVDFTRYLQHASVDVVKAIAFRDDVTQIQALSEGNLGMGNAWRKFKKKEVLKQGEIYVFRGVPGLGKDTLAEYLQAQNSALKILSKDMFAEPEVYRVDDFSETKLDAIRSESSALKPIYIRTETKKNRVCAYAYIFNFLENRYQEHSLQLTTKQRNLFGNDVGSQDSDFSLSPITGRVNFDRDNKQNNRKDYFEMLGKLLQSSGYNVNSKAGYVDKRRSFIGCLKQWINQGESVLVTSNYETIDSLNKDFKKPVMVFKRGKKVSAENPFAHVSLTCIDPLDLSNKNDMHVLYALIFSVLSRGKHATLNHDLDDALKIKVLFNFFIKWENKEDAEKVRYFSAVPQQEEQACQILAQALARYQAEDLHECYNVSDLSEEQRGIWDEIIHSVLEQVNIIIEGERLEKSSSEVTTEDKKVARHIKCQKIHEARRALPEIAQALESNPALSRLFVENDSKIYAVSSHPNALFKSSHPGTEDDVKVGMSNGL